MIKMVERGREGKRAGVHMGYDADEGIQRNAGYLWEELAIESRQKCRSKYSKCMYNIETTCTRRLR